MIVIVTGGRDYNGDIDQALEVFDSSFPIKMLIHGGARGADQRSGHWATEKGIHVAVVPALWDHYGKAAGWRRNDAMLLLKPEYCVQFPGGRGTADMVKRCVDAGVPVWSPYGGAA